MIYVPGFNTVIVLCSVIFLGAACGVIGAYIMFYKKALVTDAVSHATLPGIALGFTAAYLLGLNDGKFLPLLLLGGAMTAAMATFSINQIAKSGRLTIDTAISTTLSFFYGLGIVFFSIVQNMESGNRSGLQNFLLGQTSGITLFDAYLICGASFIVIILGIYFHRYFILQSFDNMFSIIASPVRNASIIISFLMLIIVCTGLKTTGAILILALLIIPAGTARLLSEHNKPIIALSATLGVSSATGGVILSNLFNSAPTGATIVSTAFTFFLCAAAYYAVKKLINMNRTRPV